MASVNNRREARQLTTADIDPVAAYLGELRKRLNRGPVRRSPERAAQILAEAEDHLRSATAARVADGAPEQEAQRAAIASFGQPRTVARAHRPRPTEVLKTLAIASAPLVSTYLLICAAVGAAWLYREDRQLSALSGGQVLEPSSGGTPSPVPMAASSSGIQDQAGWIAVSFGVCLLAALLLLAGYVIARRRQARTDQAKAGRIPVPGFFPPLAAAAIVTFGWAEFQGVGNRNLLTWLGSLVQVHTYHESLAALFIGSLAATILLTAACTLWTVALATRWSYTRLRTLTTR